MLTYNDMLLVQLAEECNEVAQRVAKCLRFGMDDVQAGTDTNGEPWPTNEARLTREIVDLQAMLSMCADAGIIGTKVVGSFDGDMCDRMHAKARRVHAYMELSIKNNKMHAKVPYCRAKFEGPFVEKVPCTHEDMVPLQRVGEAKPYAHYCNKCGYQECAHVHTQQNITDARHRQRKRCIDCNKQWRRPRFDETPASILNNWVEL